MAIKIQLQKEAAPIFTKMAKEAGIGVRDLAEIACYNLIAIYTNEKGYTAAEDSPDVRVTQPDSPPEPVHSTE